jgi:hypothetical protein
MAATEPTGGHVSAESQTPLYYLRGMTSSDRTYAGNGGSSSSGAITGGGGLLSLEESRRIQLREEHPTYNEFMIDMTLYQEQQSAREVNRKKREAMEKNKERRLAARLKEVDALVSLPTLKDAKGNPVPLDKKALAWLRQYHPHLADQFNRLIRLSVSVVDSAQQRNVLTDEQVEARVSARELELNAKAEEHEKQRLKGRQLRVDRLEWFRGEYEKRKSKAEIKRGADEEQIAKETLAVSRQRSDAAISRRQQQLEASSRALHDDLLERSLRLEEHRRQVARQGRNADPQRHRHVPSSPLRAEVIAESAKSRNAERESQHVELMASVSAKDKERADSLRLAQVEAQKKIDAVAADRKALTDYQHSAHTTHSKQVIGRCVESLEAALKHKQLSMSETQKRIDAALLRREAASAVVAERARDTAVFVVSEDLVAGSSSSSRGGGGGSGMESPPRYAQSIGNLSPRSSAANMSRIASQRKEKDSPKKHSSRHDVEVLVKATALDEQKYAASLAALDRSVKEVSNATKRRDEYIEDTTQQHQQRAKHDAQVRARHEQQLAEELALRMSKIEAEDGKVRTFIPHPPRLYKGMKVPAERRSHSLSPSRRAATSPKSAEAVRAAAQQDQDRRKMFDEHLGDVKGRFMDHAASKRAHAMEAHDQQLIRETAAAESRREALRELQYETKRSDASRHRAAEQRLQRALQERLERTYDDSATSSASARRAEAQLAQSSRTHDATVEKQQRADARRGEMHQREESRILDDVRTRQLKHQHMFQVQ